MAATSTENSPGSRARRLPLLRWAGWFSFANTCLLLLISWRYLRLVDWPAETAARIFLAVATLAAFTTLGLLLGGVLALVALVWPNRWAVGGAGLALASLFVLGVIVDSIVFTLYRFHLNGMVLSLIRNGGITEILPLSFNTRAIALALAAGVLAVEAGVAVWISRRANGFRGWGKDFVAAAVAVIVTGHLMHIWADAVQYTPITKLVRYLPAYRPLTAKRALAKLGFKVIRGERVTLKTKGTALKYPLRPLACSPPARPFNVLFIVIDGWRYDMLSEAATPGLFQFSRRSLRFDHHSAAANATRFGIFTLCYGLYGTYWHAMLAEQKGPVLISELNQAGYQFGVFASARLTSPEFDRTVFSEIRDRIPLQTPGDSAPNRDREITRRMRVFLDGRRPEQPFFGFLFYDSTHAYDYPPDAPAPFQPVCPAVDHLKLDNNFDPAPVRNRFLNAAHYVDSLAAPLLERLERESLLDRTIVVITGDHGQEFNDTKQNYWGHNSNFSRYQTQVPLVVYWPGKAPAVITYPTSHLDVAPTLLAELFGCATSLEKFSTGKSLFDPAPRVPLLIATWGHFALASPGRIDVLFETGGAEHYDEDYHALSTPLPPKLIPPAMEGMSRFYAR